eukprot:362822-Chlamydomonas_euryale.AAC.5
MAALAAPSAAMRRPPCAVLRLESPTILRGICRWMRAGGGQPEQSCQGVWGKQPGSACLRGRAAPGLNMHALAWIGCVPPCRVQACERGYGYMPGHASCGHVHGQEKCGCCCMPGQADSVTPRFGGSRCTNSMWCPFKCGCAFQVQLCLSTEDRRAPVAHRCIICPVSAEQHGTARYNSAQHGTTRHSTAQHGTARTGAVQHTQPRQATRPS